jgi:hypothetical protein
LRVDVFIESVEEYQTQKDVFNISVRRDPDLQLSNVSISGPSRLSLDRSEAVLSGQQYAVAGRHGPRRELREHSTTPSWMASKTSSAALASKGESWGDLE